MPTFTIDISDKARQRLQAIVDRYNGNNGTSVTVQQWLLRTIKEMAISDELATGIEQLRRQAETDANAALEAALAAERDRLVADLDAP